MKPAIRQEESSSFLKKRRLFFFSLIVAASGHACAETCTVAATGVAFGIYVPLTGPAVTSTGTVTVTCNPDVISILVSYTITLSTGGGGSFAARSMGGPTPRLGYQLYRDSADTQVWGDGTAGTYTVTDSYLLGLILPVVRNYTVYGRLPGAEAGSVGSYLDTVTVTVTY